MLRKILLILFSFTGPILYSVASWLPYAITGVLCFICSAFFVYFTQRQQRANDKKIAHLLEIRGKDRESAIADTVQTYQRMTLASREAAARMASVIIKVKY